MPGLASRPNARDSAKLPIGVADRDSLAWVVSPAEPTWAVTPAPCGSQPPPGAFVQACRVAVALCDLR